MTRHWSAVPTPEFVVQTHTHREFVGERYGNVKFLKVWPGRFGTAVLGPGEWLVEAKTTSTCASADEAASDRARAESGRMWVFMGGSMHHGEAECYRLVLYYQRVFGDFDGISRFKLESSRTT